MARKLLQTPRTRHVRGCTECRHDGFVVKQVPAPAEASFETPLTRRNGPRAYRGGTGLTTQYAPFQAVMPP
ncbi:MAG: hypothetical protein ACK4VM_08110, partial [Bosea sp. (in: a-proteobacteria)]